MLRIGPISGLLKTRVAASLSPIRRQGVELVAGDLGRPFGTKEILWDISVAAAGGHKPFARTHRRRMVDLSCFEQKATKETKVVCLRSPCFLLFGSPVGRQQIVDVQVVLE